jgi:peptidyl-prolyl cis-trans isomerase D
MSMFDLVHKHKIVLQTILGMIIVSFTFWGVQSYRAGAGSAGVVAEIGGIPITQQEFAVAMTQQRERIASMLGRNVDPATLDTPAMRRELLDGMISQRVLALYAAKHHMQVSDEQLRDAIAGIPSFQEDGKFSLTRYRTLLQAQNLTEAQFEHDMRSDLVLQQLSAGLADSAFVAKNVARKFAEAREQKREVSQVTLAPEDFRSKVKIAPDAVEAYYKANQKEFETPEQVRVEYVVLNRDLLAQRETVSPEEVKAIYEQSFAARYKERAAVRAKIDEILAEARKDPEKFAELAKKYSQDPGSAPQGGDLGYFGRGAMVKPFEDEAFKLKEGEISPVVESEFGFHIIKLTGKRKGEGGAEERSASHILLNAPQDAKSFEEAKPEIEDQIKRQRLAKKFAESAESFSNIAYEQPDSLKPLIDKFQLKPEKSDWLPRASGGGKGPLDSPRLRAAIFTDDVIKNKRNSEVVEIAPGQLVVARMIDHKPAAMRPLDAVRGEIVQLLTDKEARVLAQKAGEEMLAQLRAGKSVDLKWPAAKTVSREDPKGLDTWALAAVFRVDAAKVPAYTGLGVGAKGYALFRVSGVINPNGIDDQKLAVSQFGLARQEATEDFQAFVAGLRERTKIEVNPASIEKPPGG